MRENFTSKNSGRLTTTHSTRVEWASQSKQGFTIIEVLIVLAIAGLVLLIVLLAVPALQRNQRNSVRKRDVGRLAAAMTSYVSNNGGKLPGFTVSGALDSAANATNDENTILGDIGTLGQYVVAANGNTVAAGKIAIVDGGTAAVAALGAPTGDEIVIVGRAKCSGAGTVVGNSRTMAIQYTLESGNNAFQGYCQDAN